MLKRLILLMVLITLSSSVYAQRFHKSGPSYGSRDGRFEASFLINYENSVTKDNLEGGSSLEIDKKTGWGITLGWNWNSKFNTAYKLTVVNPDYSAYIVPEDPAIEPQTLNYNASKVSHQLNATYNFLEGKFTPFVQAGVGVTSLDSNVPDQPPTTGCWWDPWWGYICTTTWSTYKTTKFSYNAGVGVRWDVNNVFYLRGSYSKEWISVDSGSLSFDSIVMEAGMMF